VVLRVAPPATLGGMFTPIGLGALLLVVGLATLFVPGIAVIGVLLMIVGVLLVAGAFASGRRRSAQPPAS
jgi:uncharacterized membrane protein HdeD (DUF308 family)